MDITYIRLVSGWMYLVAFLDWYSRYVVAWELSDTLEMDFVVACAVVALEVASPRSSTATREATSPVSGSPGPFWRQASGIKISRWTGRGRYVDNIFTERLWRTVKYEEVYLTEYETPRDARQGLSRYLHFYNEQRLHQALGYRTPAQIYHDKL